MKRLLIRFIFYLCLAGAAFLGWKYRDQLIGLYQANFGKDADEYTHLVPDPDRYEILVRELTSQRRQLSGRYSSARTAQEIATVHREAREALEEALPALMRCWLGTKYDFHGTARKPGGGKIACGYFVSTVMQDAGFDVNRIELAQQASQNIIGTFLTKKEMHIRTGTSYDDFLQQVVARGPGVRIVGLDNHAAFIVVNKDRSVRFIHSSGGKAQCVVDEDREAASTLRSSSYRVTGNITGSDELVHKWLTNAPWPTQL